jgi:hypothetical protein
MSDHIKIFGDVSMRAYVTETGKTIDTFEENNIFLTQGKSEIFRAFTIDNAAHVIKTIKIGDDVGTGDVTNPQQPTAAYTELNQSVKYEVPLSDFSVTYPTENTVRFLATVNGASVMALYPSEPNIIYTSATLVTNANKAVAYKRFSARTISSLISVDITWTLRID